MNLLKFLPTVGGILRVGQTDRHTHRQTDRQTHTDHFTFIYCRMEIFSSFCKEIANYQHFFGVSVPKGPPKGK